MKTVLIKFSVETVGGKEETLTLRSEFELGANLQDSKLVHIQKNGSVYISSKNNTVVKKMSSKDWERYFSVNLSFEGAYVKTGSGEINLHFPTIEEQ